MAITGTLLGGTIALSQNGTCTMGASVSLQDDQLGQVGQRSIPVDDPQVIAQVQQFVAQMLPLLSQQAGFPIALPVTSDSDPTV